MNLPAYGLMGAVASKYVWTAWSIVIGRLRPVALYVNGSWRRTPLIWSAVPPVIGQSGHFNAIEAKGVVTKSKPIRDIFMPLGFGD